MQRFLSKVRGLGERFAEGRYAGPIPAARRVHVLPQLPVESLVVSVTGGAGGFARDLGGSERVDRAIEWHKGRPIPALGGDRDLLRWAQAAHPNPIEALCYERAVLAADRHSELRLGKSCNMLIK